MLNRDDWQVVIEASGIREIVDSLRGMTRLEMAAYIAVSFLVLVIFLIASIIG